MVDVRSSRSPDPPNDQDGAKGSPAERPIWNRRITHTKTAIVENNRFITIDTLEIRLPKNDSESNSSIVHHRIFDAIKKIDDSSANISLDQVHINHNKELQSGEDYNKTFKD